jgi:hypothetical protein
MKNTTHTETWETRVCIPDGSADALWHVCRSNGGDLIAFVESGDPEHDARLARLIAAAPDLLAACEEMVKAFRRSSNVPVTLNTAYSALKTAMSKAKGS